MAETLHLRLLLIRYLHRQHLVLPVPRWLFNVFCSDRTASSAKDVRTRHMVTGAALITWEVWASGRTPGSADEVGISLPVRGGAWVVY